MPSDDTKFHILHQHYQDTLAAHQQHISARDRFFFLVLATVGIMLFQMAFPQAASNAFAQFIAKKFEIGQEINTSFVSALIWFFLLALTIRYFQIVVNIERQYGYIHHLESLLSKHYDGKAFTREGKHYLSKYPSFSNWAHCLYTWVFPLLLIVLASAKLWSELRTSGCPPPFSFWIDTVIGFSVIISAVLYMRLIHSGK